MLCDRGINVNSENKDGDTCLNLCVKNGAKENVRIIQKLLFDFKADPNIFNNNNENFYSLMLKEAQKEKVNLEEYGLTEDLNNLFLNKDSPEENFHIKGINDLSHKIEGKTKKSNYLGGYIFYYFVCVVIVIISNLVMKYK